MKQFLYISFIFLIGIGLLGSVNAFAGGGNKSQNKKETKAKIQKKETKEVAFYPNPTKGKVNIVFANTPDVHPAFTVFNILGTDLRNIEVTQISKTQFEIDLSDKDAGLYFIRIQTPSISITERITLDFKVNYTIS